MSCAIFAQSFQGNYFIATSNGEITLSLSSQDDVNYSGKLIDDEGSEYTVIAQIDNEGGIVGTVSGSEEEAGFAAYPNDQTMYVVLVPVGADGEPAVDQMQKFPMARREEELDNSAKAGGPLMNFSDKNSWNGTYYGDINGTATSLILSQQGNTVQGRIDADGYIYNISGNLENDMLNGELTDPQTQGSMICKGSMENGVILLTMSDNTTGQSFQLTYSRNSQGGNNNPNPTTGNVSTAIENAERDPNLVGDWIYSKSYVSGTFSFVSQWRFIVYSDGSYAYGDAKMAGGGPGSSVQSDGGDWECGQWKTENKNIYTNVGNGWELYTGYYIEGNTMMMKFDNGSKQIWKR